MKSNPDYKGQWFAPMIDNPAYIGEWAPRKIANPDYFEDNTPTESLNKIVRSVVATSTLILTCTLRVALESSSGQ
jgi:hypothetical protein